MATDAPPDAKTNSVAYFCAVTSKSPFDSWSFLEGHNFDLEEALDSFYRSADVDADGPDPVPRPPTPAADDGAGSEDEDYFGGGGGDKDEDDEDSLGGGEDEEVDASFAALSAALDKRKRVIAKRLESSHQARAGIGGSSWRLSDLGGGKRAAVSDDDEWAPPPELYTGGASSAIPGTSRHLTGDTVQSDAPQSPEKIVHNIYFWSNGFTVNDGPFRSFDDPEYASFLKSIKNSECPTELASDGRSKVKLNLVHKQQRCPEPVKRPAPFQGGGRSGTAAFATHLASRPTIAATFPNHPGEHTLVALLREWIRGDTQPWIYEANVYAEDPASMTAKYLPAIAEDGSRAWYFVCIPRKKDGNDCRISRIAGLGTWKEDRKLRVQAASPEGHHVEVGWKQTFSYTIKGEAGKPIHTGWKLKCIMLNDGEDIQNRCLCKVYPSPRTAVKANLLVSQLAAAAASKTKAPVAPAATVAATAAAPAGATAAAAAPTAATTSPPSAAAAGATAAAAGATAAAAAAAAAPAPAAGSTTPSLRRKWVQVQISDSPTKSSHGRKQVYQIIDFTAQEGESESDLSKKRMKVLNCKGYISIDPVPHEEQESP